MKRFFTTLFIALGAFPAFAKSYTGRLVVTVNGETLSNKTASIDVDQQGDGSYTLSLKNFSISLSGQELTIGTINIPATPYALGNARLLQANRNVPINNLGDVPINLLAQESGDKLHANIDINFNGMTIKVVFKCLTATLKPSGQAKNQTAGIRSKALLARLQTLQKQMPPSVTTKHALVQGEKAAF